MTAASPFATASSSTRSTGANANYTARRWLADRGLCRRERQPRRPDRRALPRPRRRIAGRGGQPLLQQLGLRRSSPCARPRPLPPPAPGASMREQRNRFDLGQRPERHVEGRQPPVPLPRRRPGRGRRARRRPHRDRRRDRSQHNQERRQLAPLDGEPRDRHGNAGGRDRPHRRRLQCLPRRRPHMLLLPAADYASTTVYELTSDGRAQPLFETAGWASSRTGA